MEVTCTRVERVASEGSAQMCFTLAFPLQIKGVTRNQRSYQQTWHTVHVHNWHRCAAGSPTGGFRHSQSVRPRSALGRCRSPSA